MKILCLGGPYDGEARELINLGVDQQNGIVTVPAISPMRAASMGTDCPVFTYRITKLCGHWIAGPAGESLEMIVGRLTEGYKHER